MKSRTYLYVPYEEYPQLKRFKAHFDSQLKCWYIEEGQDREKFKRWLGEADPDAPEVYVIESKKAFIATANTPCWHCGKKTPVATIYCENGKVDGEPYRQFTVSNITGVDEALKQQLEPLEYFRYGFSEELQVEGFTNYCIHCKEPQADFLLHIEPSGPFFAVKEGLEQGLIELTPLKGTVRLNGDEGFEP